MKKRVRKNPTANGILEVGIFRGGELEPGTFHGRVEGDEKIFVDPETSTEDETELEPEPM